MATNISTQLKSDLLSAQMSFLTSIQTDSNALANFSDSWDNLNVRIEEAATSQLLDEETFVAAQSVASQISALAESLLEICLAEDKILSGHNHEIDEILRNAQDASESDYSRSTAPPVPHPITSQTNQRRMYPTSTDGIEQSEFMKLLSGWLLKHVHNPYPSQSRKLQLARSADVSVKAVNDWLSTARRRIGWTALCKRHFKGNRHLTVDFASRVLNEDATSSSSDVLHEFLEMKSRAERLYGPNKTRTTSSVLLRSLDQERVKSRATCIEANRSNKRRRISSVSSDQPKPDSDFNICGNESHFCNEKVLPYRGLRRSSTSSTTSASRTASVSFTDSSRETTEELPTPVIPTNDLLPIIVDSCIDSWISSVATETQVCAMKDSGLRESRKRSICDSSLSAPLKKRRTEHKDLPSEEASELLSTLCQQRDDRFDLPQFDFEFPPPVTITSNIMDGEALHLSVFDCAGWQQINHIDPSPHAVDEYTAHPSSFESASVLWGKDEDSTSLFPNSLLHPLEDRTLLGEEAGVHLDLSCFGQEIDLHDGVLPTSFGSSATDTNADCETITSPLWNLSRYQSDSCTESQVQPGLLEAKLLQCQHLEKIERIKHLLSEAAELQQEVFGS